MLKKYGYIRVGAAVNKIHVADVTYNVKEIEKIVIDAISKGVEILVFPELAITGYTCQDLFLTEELICKTLEGLEELKKFSLDKEITFIVGAPLKINNSLYNCAVSINGGKVIGVTPKTFIPNYSEFYEYRYFSSATNLMVNEFILLGENVKVSNMLLYHAKGYDFITYAVDICEDLWQTNSPSNYTSLRGANIIFNLSSSNEIVGKASYRKDLVRMAASKGSLAYVYTSSGITESTTDLLFSGHSIICDGCGDLIENERFSFESNLIFYDIDVLRLNHDRLKNRCYEQLNFDFEFEHTYFSLYENKNVLVKKYSKTPFLAHDATSLKEILNIQTFALAKRVKFLGNAKMVIGISGGADSTLAFLIALRVIKLLKMDPKDLIAITMPGFGTSNRTFENAKKLILTSGATYKEISIKDACTLHYKDIGHSLDKYDVTYENAQARERTQILFDYANMVGGIVVGTGDLSEIALGWDTYNGDHMSNYAVNASIPKTLVTTLIAKIMNDSDDKVLKETLADVLDTPISPELLPLDANGNIAQKSEANVGPYTIQDFFLYHFMRYGARPAKLYFLACETFKELEAGEIKKYLEIFIRRFFTQQFKRSCMPDGVKVGSIALSPRGDLRMSSDTYADMYLKELENL